MRHMRAIWQATILASALIADRSSAAPADTASTGTAPGSGSAVVAPPRVSGYIQAREAWQDHLGLSASLNRARIGVDGALPSRFSYRVLVEFEAPATGRTPAAVSLRDAYIRWAYAPWALTIGQYKTPFSREYLTSITAIETADRATVVDTLAPKRDLGAMGEVAIGSYATLALGVFNGEGQNASGNRDSTVLAVGRVTLRPLAQATLGGSLARYGPDSLRYGAEVSLEHRGWLLRGETIGQHRLGRARDDYGWFALGGWRVSPWLQLIVKREDFERPLIGASRRMRATTAGINLDFPGGRTRMILDFVSRKTGAAQTRRDQAIAQLQVRF
jgi:phosphate-selective porin O/P